MVQIVLASHNAHKLEELRRILVPLVPGIELLGYDGPEPVENGVTYEQNALLKARAAATHTGLPAIADDSGISVDVLGGSPGIFSARWGGPARDDTTNLQLLLWQLSDVPEEHRSASFVCAAALALPRSDRTEAPPVALHGDSDPFEVVTLRHWRGCVLSAPSGDGGFGYDPIFRPDGETRSAAQLSAEEKDAMSHRRRAFTALAPEIVARLSPHGDG